MAKKEKETEETQEIEEDYDADECEEKKKGRKITAIEDLPGVGAATAEKLRLVGFSELMNIAVATPGELIDSTGMNSATAKKIIAAARTALDMGFESGDALLKKRSSVIKITTSSKAFDALVGGGFETRAITECFGQYGCAKCISKDTPVFYFNDSKAHLQPIAEVYDKYKQKFGEEDYDGGTIVKVPPVQVIGLTKQGLKKTNAKYIYKQFASKIYEIRTKRGRTIKITGPHKLLTVDEKGMTWKPAGAFEQGDILAYPKKIGCHSEGDVLDADDAYFLGLFAAEGTPNPLSISIGSEKLKDWLGSYCSDKFNYVPTTRTDRRRQNPIYTVLLRNASKKLLSGLENSKAGSKFVPESILSGNDEIIKSFIAGYLDGDGHIGKEIMEVTTASKQLAGEVSYLFARIGISSTQKKTYVDGKGYFRVSVVGEDRILLNDLPLKIKSANYSSRNSAYGYKIAEYLRNTYKQTLGGFRGRTEKAVGRKKNSKDIFYHYLTNKRFSGKALNEKTLKRVALEFYNGLNMINQLIKKQDVIESFDANGRKAFFKKLPFALNSVNTGLKKDSVQNYVSRGLPKDHNSLNKFKSEIKNNLEIRKSLLENAVKTIKNILYLNWDVIDSAREIEYNDFVYDFVVPDGHCFVGGTMPTIMHNTQLAHQLAVNVQMNDAAGVEPYAVYIDTEGTFRPERVIEIAKGAGLDPEKALKHIKVARAFNSDHQMLLAEKVEDLIKEGLNVKLVIVDSLTAHFRAEFVGRGTLAERQQKLNKHMHVLAKIADAYNLCVYVTNQVMAKPDQFFGDPTEAIGGNIVAHNSTFRIYLRRGKKGSRVGKLIDAPNLPDGECAFMITTDGIRDL
jgi:DNA repair protein RadA